jgi:hypothetical protein
MEIQSTFFQKLSIVLFTPFSLIKSQYTDRSYLDSSTQKYVGEKTRPSR